VSGDDVWQTAYLAVTVALGDTVDDALSSLSAGEAGLSRRGAALAGSLRSGSREARVRSLAQALSEVALGVEAMVAS
jgi:hypothetical protein